VHVPYAFFIHELDTLDAARIGQFPLPKSHDVVFQQPNPLFIPESGLVKIQPHNFGLTYSRTGGRWLSRSTASTRHLLTS
jgi:hypothetical protein